MKQKQIAVTRDVSSSLARCELAHIERCPIDLENARAQHILYVETLADLGCELVSLPEEPELPDSVFVEDTAIVLDETALITRPGAVSRRGEVASIVNVLKKYRDLRFVEPPGTVDGGDVLVAGKTVFVGMTGRSNREGAEQIRCHLAPFGYTVKTAAVDGCLHLKSAVTAVAEKTLLINRDWADASPFKGFDLIDVDPAEPHAGNALLIGTIALFPTSYPRTRQRLADHGISVREVDLSELAKAEGAVTCCSLLFRVS